MMRGNQQPADEQHLFDFLMQEYQMSFENLWKSWDRVWDIYRFYITLISGLSALLLGLLTVGVAWDSLYPVPAMLALVVFILGTALFVQLVNIDIAFKKTHTRMQSIRRELARIIPLDTYLADVSQAKAEWVYWEQSYSLAGLVKRGFRGAGVKTQVILINSAIAAAGILYRVWPRVSTNTGLIVAVAFGAWISLIAFHGGLALIKGRLEEQEPKGRPTTR